MMWLINDLLPRGDRGMDSGMEGCGKTTFGNWLSVCIASGKDLFGQEVQQGNVLIIDEETPFHTLEQKLNRFSQGLGYPTYEDLPIRVCSMKGFRFNRKTERDKLLEEIEDFKPTFIRMDSLISMIPSGRQGLCETDSGVGISIRDDLNMILGASPGSSSLLSAHSCKPVEYWTLEQYAKAEMPSLVRGHGSIVGEACDTGFGIKKLSQYPDPLRLAVFVKARRSAVPMSDAVLYLEMKEEKYGEGWARLERIPPPPIEPCKPAKDLYPLFLNEKPYEAMDIVRTCALLTKTECRMGVEELLEHRIIVKGSEPQTFKLNVNGDHDEEYLEKLT